MGEMILIAVVSLAIGAGAAAAVFALLRRQAAGAGEAAELTVELSRQQADAAARLEAMIGMLAKGQSQLQHAVGERLDAVSHRMNQSMATTTQQTVERLQGLHERLAVIDRAQKNISELSSQVTSLQNVLGNKQQRGAFGQGRMEIIIQDALPKGSYEFQYTLPNRTRPDCCIFLPDQRPLVIDAKFPLEAVTAFREATNDDERKQAAVRLRSDVAKHVADISSKYLIPGETQDLAFMFVPSESVYAELHETFDDIVQKAFRAKVVIVSPSLLMIAIQVIQQIQRDSRMREAADQIHVEVGHLLEDLRRMRERVLKLKSHFTQADEDVRQILLSSEKIEKRGARMTEVEFAEDDARDSATIIAAPIIRKLEAGE
jgi:DNA recombination protein RmuC